MPKKPTGLGRGLDIIFDDNELNETAQSDGVRTIRISSIDPKADQPRKNFDSEALAQLAESIAANGVLQPILVRREGERYQIIAGERRFRGAKLAGLVEIPALVLEADDLNAAKFALIENIQREDLNPYEEAQAYDRLMQEYGLSQDEVAQAIGKSRSAVANSLRLLDLPEEVVKMLVSGVLTAGHGRTLLGLRDANQIIPLAQKCVNRNLSVREMEQVVKQANRAYAASLTEAESVGTPLRVDYFASLESRFTAATGRRCKISETRNKKVFQIEYRDNEDLEEVLKLLAGGDILDEF